MYRKGTALLVVLFIVMIATIVSLGFLSRSDTELACGQNMLIRTKMDYLAESGLEHARGLILNPQDIQSETWSGAEQQQLVSDQADYYDVEVLKLQERSYRINCESYRFSNGQTIAQSSLEAELWLYPCIGLWTNSNTSLSGDVSITADVYCQGNLFSSGLVDGDAFVGVLNASITGKQRSLTELSLNWPSVEIEDYTSRYPVVVIDVNSLTNTAFGPYEPVKVCYHDGDLSLQDEVVINSMLIVNGSLTIHGLDNLIAYNKNLPALFVAGNINVIAGSDIDITGLVIVKGGVQIDGRLDIQGSLFMKDDIIGIGDLNITASGSKASILTWPGGETQNWSPTAGTVYRSIVRK